MLLSADWHLTDRPEDEYRWDVFARIKEALQETGDQRLFILGDITDRKDRHSAALVNRLVHELSEIHVTTTIIMGNHDMPLRGPPFWSFLDKIGIEFITKPLIGYGGNLLLLPYAADPLEEWKGLPFKTAKAAFIHQTVTGVKTDNGMTLENNKMPIFPRHLKVYSGDIHTPQVVGRVTYVGAPHPVDFGDDYICRLLRLDDNYEITKKIILNPMWKHVLEISSVAELASYKIKAGDQVKIRVNLSVNDIEQWPAEQVKIARWAVENNVTLSSTETLLQDNRLMSTNATDTFNNPAEVIKMFAEAEGLDQAMLEAGLAILHKEKGS